MTSDSKSSDIVLDSCFFCLVGFDRASCVFEASFELALQLRITWNFQSSCLCPLGIRITGMNLHAGFSVVLVVEPGALCFLGRDSHPFSFQNV